MNLESGPSNQNLRNAPKEISLNLDPRTGKHWHLDKDRRVIILDETGDYERDRQQLDSTSEPAPGHPKYASNITIAEMPVAPGEIAPEIPEDAPAPGSTEQEHQGPPFENDEKRKEAQDGLRKDLDKLEGSGVDPTPLLREIDAVNSPAAVERIAKDIGLLSKVRSPLRSTKRPPWAR